MTQKKFMKKKCGMKESESGRNSGLTLRVVFEREMEEEVTEEVFEDTEDLYLKEM